MLQTLKRPPAFYRQLWHLSLPIALQNLITFSLGLIDTFMVSQLGNEEMAAVTAANIPVFIMTSLVFGLQSGLGILVSQYWGKRDVRNINRAMGVAAGIGGGIMLLLSLVFFFFPVAVMDLLSNRHALSLLGAPYLKWIGFAFLCNMLSSIYVSAQRSIGNPHFGMLLFAFSTVLNTLFNYVLIFGKLGFPALGVEGAAVATLLSRIVELVICVISALRGKRIPLDFACLFRPGGEMLRRFLRYSSTVVLSETLWGFGNSMMTVILGYTHNSVDMLAANAIMGNLSRLFLVLCSGLGSATSVMVGNAIGEEQDHAEVQSLAEGLLLFSVLVGVILSAVSLLLLPTLFCPVVFPLFQLYGEAASIATALAVANFLAIPINACAISGITGVLWAGGDVTRAMISDVTPQWVLAIPLTALTALVLQSNGWVIAFAMQTDGLLKVPLCLSRIHSRKWIHDVTVSKEEL